MRDGEAAAPVPDVETLEGDEEEADAPLPVRHLFFFLGGGEGVRGVYVCVLTIQLLHSFICACVLSVHYLEDVRAGLDVLCEGHVGQGVEPQLAAGRVDQPAKCWWLCASSFRDGLG